MDEQRLAEAIRQMLIEHSHRSLPTYKAMAERTLEIYQEDDPRQEAP